MKKIVLYRIISIVFVVVTIIWILAVSTKMPNEQSNGFVRKIIANELPILQSAEIESSVNKITGISDNSIYLAGENPKAILILNKRNLSPRDTLIINLNFPIEKLFPFSTYVDTPWLYIHINNMKTIVYGKFPNDKLAMTKLKGSAFTKSIQISSDACVIKSVDPSKKSQTLQKINTQTGEVINEINLLSNNCNNDENWIVSDGMLQYNHSNNRVIYVEYLKNKFYCLDSNLNLIYKGNTIDTVSVNEIKMIKEAESGGKVKLVPSEARITVNKSCFVDNNHLYILSGLRADNESLKKFNTNTVIDSYNLTTGKYTGSFYIPNNQNGIMKSAMIANDTLTALFDKKIIAYRLATDLN